MFDRIYSTVILTTSLDARGSQAARAGTPKGLLPGYQPTTRKLIVNMLSRHKRCSLLLCPTPSGYDTKKIYRKPQIF